MINPWTVFGTAFMYKLFSDNSICRNMFYQNTSKCLGYNNRDIKTVKIWGNFCILVSSFVKFNISTKRSDLYVPYINGYFLQLSIY